MRPFTLQQAHAEVDRIWHKALRDNGTKASCCKGCSACCWEPVLTSTEEARLALKKLPEDKLDWVKTKAKTWLQVFQASGLMDNPEPHVMEYKRHALPCPLLDHRGQCLVYDHRPLPCRVHTAIGPAELCATDRMKQTYAQSSDIDMLIGGILFCNGGTADHLGILLNRLLFGSSARSAAAAIAAVKLLQDWPDLQRHKIHH